MNKVYENYSIPQEIVEACRLKPENLDYVYSFGKKNDWGAFNRSIVFPEMDDEDMNKLAVLVYDRFVGVTSMSLLRNFVEYFGQKCVKRLFYEIPFHRDLTEIFYICNFIKLLNMKMFGWILSVLYEDTDENEVRQKWLSQLNNIMKKYHFEIVLEGKNELFIKEIPKPKKNISETEYRALSPSELKDNKGLIKKASYRYELFGYGYWEFIDSQKYRQKLEILDQMFEKSTFPLEEKVILNIAYVMYEWCFVQVKSHSFYYIAKYFDDISFNWVHAALSSFFFPFEPKKRWINLFWILLKLSKPCIESLLGHLYTDTPEDSALKRMEQLNGLLKENGYEAKFSEQDRGRVKLIKLS